MANLSEIVKQMMPGGMPNMPEAQTAPAPAVDGAYGEGPDPMSDAVLLKLFQKCKKESMDSRWVFERQWLRNIYYVLGRQWIYYNGSRGEWQDKRLAKWIPRPVTQKAKEIVQTIRSMFAAINIGVNMRPNGQK